MNVVAADVLGQVGFTFWSYQVLFSLLNLLLFVSVCLRGLLGETAILRETLDDGLMTRSSS